MARPRLTRLAIVAALTGALLAPAAAEATHGRYFHYTAETTGTDSEFRLYQGWNASFGWSCINVANSTPTTPAPTPCTGGGGNPGLNDVISSTDSFSFGDAASLNTPLLVTAVSLIDNSVSGIVLDPASFPQVDDTVAHAYGASGAFTAFTASCCRISASFNAGDDGYRAEVVVQPGSANDPPVSSLPPTVRCPAGGTCNFLIPTSDPNGDAVAFRMATSAEAGFTAQPQGASVAPNGIYSFDTDNSRGPASPGQAGDQYSTQVVMEDGNGGKSVVDFIIRLVSNTGSSPAFDEPPSPCGDSFTTSPGQQVSFQVQASDADSGDSVELNVAGLPPGAVMSPQLPTQSSPGLPISSTFSWTPSGNATGTNVVTFTATDSGGRQTLCSTEILVNPVGVGDASVTEGETARFTIGLEAPSGSPVTVNWETLQGTATSGGDFQAQSGSLTIPAGIREATVEVPTIDDATPEGSETFTVELSGAQGAPLGRRSGVGTIADNDSGGEIPPPPPPPPPAGPLTVTLDPPSTNRSEVERHTVTATVKRGAAPVEGQALRFRVTGPNPQSGSGATDAAGQARFGWIGQSTGTDTAVAYVDENGDNALQAGEPQASAQITWTGGLPPGIETARTIHGLPDPKTAQTANFAPVGNGEVFVKLPGPGSRDPDTELPNADTDSFASQSLDKGFIPLREAAQLPVGTIIDSDQGRIKVETAVRARSRRVQRADFFDGSFRFTQPRARNAVTEMVMTGGRFRQTCSVSKRGSSRRSGAGPQARESARRQRGGRSVRRLWGSGKGRFRTRGRYSSATVRGTRWLVEDRCEGTLTRVRTGTVTVRDFPRSRTVAVRRGTSYFADRRPRRLDK